ncbi:lysozyme inhibitor LprI family protein [Leptospira ryugenii]|uniref:lysozyme inhibitor LprI family protein n=1 Tax=Leptospira ryugenii TaxID=1917863 RepID=UPI000D59BFB0|nr:lysozyme inhibitor LprI family protein [Leptospira ryugenii]
MKNIFFCFSFLFLIQPAFADNCDKVKEGFDGLYCLQKVFFAADKDLNDAYKKLNTLLDKNAKSKLKEGQLKWINERNTECSWKDERGSFVNMECATTKTISRTNFLNDRIRECKSTGCQPSELK